MKRYIKPVLFLFFVFLFLWLADVFLNLKYARNTIPVKITVDIDKKGFSKIDAYRISPSGFKSLLIKDIDNRSFYSYKNEYLKNIMIAVPDSFITNLKSLTVLIGEKKFIFLNNVIKNEWRIESKDKKLYITSPDYLYYKHSNLQIKNLNEVINWRGDYHVFIYSLIKYFICFFVSLLVILFLYKFAVKYLSKKSSNEILNNINRDENAENIILKNYEYREKEYILKNNVKIKDRLDCFLIIDFYDKNYIKKIYWFSVFLIIFIGLFLRLSINSLPYSGGDTWGYIGPAVNWFENAEFTHVYGRSFPYPFFVLLNLLIFNDFSYLSIIQHCVGVITGIILLILWISISKYFIKDAIKNLYFNLTGLVLFALYLFSKTPVIWEHHLQPESIYAFFLILQAFFVFNILRYLNNNEKKYYFYGILFFINNYFLFIFQPRWGLTLIFNLIIYLICFFILKAGYLKKILYLIAIPVVLTFLLVYIPENILMKNDTARGGFLSGTLFWAHSKIIDIELKKDIKDAGFNKYDKNILKQASIYMNEMFNRKQSKHKYLGFFFNKLLYGEADRYLHAKLTEKEYNQFCKYYFIKSVFKHPFLYSKKVLLELSQFYNFYGGMYINRDHKIDQEIYADGYDSLYKYDSNSNYLPFLLYVNALKNIKKTFYNFNKPSLLCVEVIFFLLSVTYIIIFIIFFVIFILNFFNKKIDRKNLLFGIFILILFLYNFFISLSSSMIYCLDVDRYIDDQLIIVIFSNFLAIAYIFLYKPLHRLLYRSAKIN